MGPGHLLAMLRSPLKKADPGIVEPVITAADCDAMVAVVSGVASPQQAKHAMDWVMREGARIHDMTFMLGGEDGRRASDFADGRRYVGQQIVRLLQPATRELVQDNGKPAPSMSDRVAEQVALNAQGRTE